MIPIPRHLSADCGYCVRIKTDNSLAVEMLLKSGGIEYQEIKTL